MILVMLGILVVACLASFGGDHREGSDQYWISVCEKYNLPYFVLSQDRALGRILEAQELINKKVNSKLSQLAYDRKGL